MSTLMPLLIKEMSRVLADMKAGRLECDEQQISEAMAVIAHRPVSKDVACNEVLHWSRSKFDEYVAKGLMPKGRKRRGWKELVWYEDELLKAKRRVGV